MNNRIQELAVHAKFMAEEDINKQISYNTELNAFADKFSELILKECISIVSQDLYSGHTHSEFSNGADWALAAAIKNIKQQFEIN